MQRPGYKPPVEFEAKLSHSTNHQSTAISLRHSINCLNTEAHSMCLNTRVHFRRTTVMPIIADP